MNNDSVTSTKLSQDPLCCRLSGDDRLRANLDALGGEGRGTEGMVVRCLWSDFEPTTGQPEGLFLEDLASKTAFLGFIGR